MSSNYIFRFPEGTPDLTFDDLAAWLGGRSGRAIGTTVVIAHMPATETQFESIDIELYGLVIARLMNKPGRVEFPSADDPHLATTEWISKVVRDNCVGSSVGRIRRSRKDPLGPPVARGRAGLLVIYPPGDRSKQVFGQMYPVSRARIAKARKADARRQVEWAAQREQYAAESSRLEALKTTQHPVLGPVHAVADIGKPDEWNWRAVDGQYFDTLGWINDTRITPDSNWFDVSPENTDPEAEPFAAFTEDGTWLSNHATVAEALLAITDASPKTDLLAPAERAIAALQESVAELTGQETGQ